MTNSSKTTVTIVVIVLVVLGLWWYFAGQSGSGVSTGTPSAGEVSQTGEATASGGSSDAALDQNMAAVEVQMNALNTDASNADKGLSDQPVSQAE